LFAAPLAHAEQAATPLDGYGSYHFGMSVAQARAADPTLQDREGSGHGLTLLQAPNRVTFGEIGLPVHLNFRNDRLNHIVFDGGGVVHTHDECAEIFSGVIASLEQTYGALAGPPGPSEYGTPLPARTTARGSVLRAYQYGGEQITHANRRGQGWIEAVAHSALYPGVPAGSLGCEITIDLREHGPAAAPALTPPSSAQLAAARPIDATWREQPDSDAFEMTVPQYLPHGRIEVNVGLDCLVIADGRLNCVVADERPPGQFFGEFALRLSRNYRAQAAVGGEPTLGRRVHVPITLTLSGPDAAPDADAAAPAEDLSELRALAAHAPSRAALDAAQLIQQAQWIERPDAQDFARYYPADALMRGVSGRVVLECLIADDGRLQCAIAEEEPADANFALAALGIARSFRMAPRVDGQPSAGKRVRVPIRFAVAP
jgi:TonB family protein